MNRDLMVVSVCVDTPPRVVDRIRKSFKKEYSNYFIVMAFTLKDYNIKIEITKVGNE